MNWDWLRIAFSPRRSTLPTRPPMKKRDNTKLGETPPNNIFKSKENESELSEVPKAEVDFLTDEEFREIVRRGERVYII